MMDYIFKRKNDPKMYIVPRDYKVVRRYFKTVNVPDEIIPYVQPVLQSNGIYGEGDFSVKTEGINPEIYPLWYAFDNNAGTVWKSTKSLNMYLYFRNPIKISSIFFAYGNSYTPTNDIISYGSADGGQWVELGRTNTNGNRVAVTLNVNSSQFYRFYKVVAISTASWDVPTITINAEEFVRAAYSYEIEVAEGEEYDRMEETKYITRLGVKRK